MPCVAAIDSEYFLVHGRVELYRYSRLLINVLFTERCACGGIVLVGDVVDEDSLPLCIKPHYCAFVAARSVVVRSRKDGQYLRRRVRVSGKRVLIGQKGDDEPTTRIAST